MAVMIPVFVGAPGRIPGEDLDIPEPCMLSRIVQGRSVNSAQSQEIPFTFPFL